MMNENKINEKEIKDELKDEVEYVALSELCDIIPGGTPDTSNESYWNGDIEWFTPTEVGLSKYVHHSARKISEAGLKNSSAKIIPANSILLTTRATIGNVSINKNECATNQGFQNVRPKNIEQLNYLYYGLEYLRESMNKLASGSTFKEISGKEVKKLMIKNMSIDESIKVGDLLSLIDDLIAYNEERLQVKESSLKFWSHKIFNELSANHKLESLCNSVKSGGTPVSTNKDYYSGDIPFLSISDINDKYLCKTNKYITDDAINSSSAFIVPKNTLIYTMYASPCIPVINKVDVAIPQSVIALDVNKEVLDIDFLYYYLQYKKNSILSLTMTGTQANLNGNVVKNILIPKPDINKQKEISALLSLMDQDINLINKRIDNLKVIKQYYLNVIFK